MLQQVANSTTKRLERLGWTVTRPEKEMSEKGVLWEDYLKVSTIDWVVPHFPLPTLYQLVVRSSRKQVVRF